VRDTAQPLESRLDDEHGDRRLASRFGSVKIAGKGVNVP
jgi:hypothetical protein